MLLPPGAAPDHATPGVRAPAPPAPYRSRAQCWRLEKRTTLTTSKGMNHPPRFCATLGPQRPSPRLRRCWIQAETNPPAPWGFARSGNGSVKTNACCPILCVQGGSAAAAPSGPPRNASRAAANPAPVPPVPPCPASAGEGRRDRAGTPSENASGSLSPASWGANPPWAEAARDRNVFLCQEICPSGAKIFCPPGLLYRAHRASSAQLRGLPCQARMLRTAYRERAPSETSQENKEMEIIWHLPGAGFLVFFSVSQW